LRAIVIVGVIILLLAALVSADVHADVSGVKSATLVDISFPPVSCAAVRERFCDSPSLKLHLVKI
jgi:hypothetical protein